MTLSSEDIKQRIENHNRLADQLERTGGRLDIGALYEGAQRESDERAEHQRQLRERAHTEQLKKQAEHNSFMAKAGDQVYKNKETQAEIDLKEARTKAEVELESHIRKQNGLMSAEDESNHNAYKNMLGNLKL